MGAKNTWGSETQLFILMHSPSRLFYANKTMKIVIILTIFGLFGSLTNACCRMSCLYPDESLPKPPPGAPPGPWGLRHYPNVKVPGVLGKGGQMGPVTTDDSFETLAFGVCNSDGVEGLSWAEVEQCQEKYRKLLSVKFVSPTKEHFEYVDADRNGILTWSELKSPQHLSGTKSGTPTPMRLK